jgi:pilus assembly protein TadC
MFAELAQKRMLGRLEEIEDVKLPESNDELNWCKSKCSVERLGDRLGRAGFLDDRSRQIAAYLPYLFVIITTLIGLALFFGVASRSKLVFLIIGSAYSGYLLYLLLLSWCERGIKQRILFGLPIFLESIILVVESGVGLLPALSRVVRSKQGTANVVTEIFYIIYKLTSAGIPFGRALELVSEKLNNRTLQHVMLHLELSGVEGGELIPSLRSLSEHVHKEWQLSVEERVKRLENLVVFPVFVSVIGLVLLTAAVPLTSVLGLREKLQTSRGGISEMSLFGSVVSPEEE